MTSVVVQREADVWSYADGKFRLRAVVLLFINLLLFCGVGIFAYWIRSGVVFAPTMEGYTDQILGAFRFGQDTGATLGSLLLEPISVLRVEMQIGVIGLLMAALISIPILVAILYRFWSSLPFIAVVGFVAVMPWLAVTLLGSCIIASVQPFRSKYHFMSALFALVPTVIYLILAWADSRESFASDFDPVDGIKFVAPWVLAIVAAGAVFAVVLTIARLVNYRPGAITPLLTLMFGLPVVLFEQYVGRDELGYRLLLAMDRAYFADADASLGLRQALDAARRQTPIGGGSSHDVEELAAQRWLFGLSGNLDDSMHSVLTRHQWEIAERCDRFLADYPASGHGAAVLFIKARALDMRIDAREFRETNWIRCFSEFPSPASRTTWQRLAQNQKGAPLGAYAEVSLAKTDLRSGNVDRALERLRGADLVLSRYALMSPVDEDSSAKPIVKFALASHVLAAEADLGVSWSRLRLLANRLAGLLEFNRDPLYGHDPITGSRKASGDLIGGWAHFNPRDDHYRRNLDLLRRAFPRSILQDNIELELAITAVPLAARMEELQRVINKFPQGDAAPEALFRLSEANREASRGTAAAEFLVRLLTEHPNSIWAVQARAVPIPVGTLAVVEPRP